MPRATVLISSQLADLNSSSFTLEVKGALPYMIAGWHPGILQSMSKRCTKLEVSFDVTSLSKTEIGALEGEAVAQGEASDGQGGKRYYKGKPGHPDASLLDSKIVKRGETKRGGATLLVLTFDVTGFTKDEIGYLASEVEVQAEESDEHPSVTVRTRLI